ncbi:MAG: 30S ribosomal protein S17e [Candidatus Helarchaeota archaeon]
MCGKVRTETIKRISNEIYEQFPDKFNLDFENNKKMLNELIIYKSKHFRNRIAGYITCLIKNKVKREKIDNELAV